MKKKIKGKKQQQEKGEVKDKTRMACELRGGFLFCYSMAGKQNH